MAIRPYMKDKDNYMLTPQHFYDTFKKCFKEKESEFLSAYNESGIITELVVKNGNCILERTLEQLKIDNLAESNLITVKDFYSIDMIYCSSENLDPIYKGIYPQSFNALIEHENDWSKIEEEIYRLLIFRAPLKVVITYDWDDDQNAKAKNRGKELGDKKNQFIGLIKKFNEYAQPEIVTQYLFIVGNRKDNSAKEINWKAWVFDHKGNPKGLK
jgi:hypothetical protein